MNKVVKKITNYFYIGEVDPTTTTFTLPHNSLYFSTSNFKIYKFNKKEPNFIMQLNSDNMIVSKDLTVNNNVYIKENENINGILKVNADSDNYTLIKSNSILLANAKKQFIKFNFKDDDTILDIDLYDENGNKINRIHIVKNNIEFETKVTITTDTPELILNSSGDNDLDVSLIVDTKEMSIKRVSDGYKYFIIDDENNQIKLNVKTLKINAESNDNTNITSSIITLNSKDYLARIEKDTITEKISIPLIDKTTNKTLNNFIYTKDQFQVDRKDYTDTKLIASENLDAGWYSVATFDAGALDGLAKFIILDSKHHQSILLSVIHMNGNSYSDNIIIEAQAYDDAQTITYARIKKGDAGDGAVLQIYISEDTNALSVHYVGDNPLYNHWKLKNFIPNDTDPGDVNNYDNMYGSGTNNFSDSQSCSAISKNLIITAPYGLEFSDISTFGSDATIKYDSDSVYVSFGKTEALKLDNDKSIGYIFNQEALTNTANSLAETGYQTIGPIGLTIQWAKFTSTTSDDETFSFPTEFNSACYNIQITPIDADTSSSIGTFGNISNVSTTGFTFNRDDNVGDGNFTFYMFAIGV